MTELAVKVLAGSAILERYSIWQIYCWPSGALPGAVYLVGHEPLPPVLNLACCLCKHSFRDLHPRQSVRLP